MWVPEAEDAESPEQQQAVPLDRVLRIVESAYGQRQDKEHNPHGEHAHDVWQVCLCVCLIWGEGSREAAVCWAQGAAAHIPRKVSRTFLLVTTSADMLTSCLREGATTTWCSFYHAAQVLVPLSEGVFKGPGSNSDSDSDSSSS